ncbi:unnamed protein product [Urochloa decumbens]|uniref:Uncharacterized protein n=1 Tax=Urochloa decumbens TaxID=240449 RepID=A0ABC9ALH0_9POAL
MAKIASLVLLVLTVAAASISVPIDAAGAGGIIADFLENWKAPLESSLEISFEVLTNFETMDTDDGVFPRRGNDAAPRMVPVFVPATVVQAGGTSFSVAGVDVTSTVTWTSRCGGGAEAVPCGDPLCDQYGECGGGERNAIVLENDAFPVFSYVIDGDLQGSTVWVGVHANYTASATATAGRRSTTGLGPDTASRFYYVGIAGVKVGSGEVGGGVELAALGIMTTTIPFTFLKPAIFKHLEQELALGCGVAGQWSRQLCYPSGTELPGITLVFVAAAKTLPPRWSCVRVRSTTRTR